MQQQMEMLRLSSGLRRSPRLNRLSEEAKNEVRRGLFTEVNSNLLNQIPKEFKQNTRKDTKGSP